MPVALVKSSSSGVRALVVSDQSKLTSPPLAAAAGAAVASAAGAAVASAAGAAVASAAGALVGAAAAGAAVGASAAGALVAAGVVAAPPPHAASTLPAIAVPPAAPSARKNERRLRRLVGSSMA